MTGPRPGRVSKLAAERTSARWTTMFAGALALTACPATVDDLCHDAICKVEVPAGCDESADLARARACIVDSFGTFVDATHGSDDAAGTRAAPLKTIGAALARRGQRPRIYLCEGTYPEHVTVDGAVSFYGGLTCGSWEPTGGRATIAPTDPGVVLTIKNVNQPSRFVDLTVVAQDADEVTKSSVAVFAASSAAPITFRRVAVLAGNTIVGPAPTAPVLFNVSDKDPTGISASGSVGGQAITCTCSISGISRGGAGGAATLGTSSAPAGNGEDGTATPASAPVDGTQATGKGGTGINPEMQICVTGYNGYPGAPGQRGTDGGLGSLTIDGWLASRGGDGEPGHPGGGGGGGGGSGERSGGGGGGGGCGGCGGAGGAGGAGGGSSIAIAALDVAIALESSTLTARNGEDGAAGTNGGLGLIGGKRGASGSGPGCVGADGGPGAGGSGGGGGAGGSSIGVAYHGPAPTVDSATTITVGSAGKGGAPGGAGQSQAPNGNAGLAGGPGRDGLAQAVVAL